jgi:hypothetical protein
MIKVFFLVALSLFFNVFQVEKLKIIVPKSKDLTETDKHQRRDLSIPNSRIVLNFYDFQTTLSAVEYSNRNTLPLNVGWLSTKKNSGSNSNKTWMNRAIPDILRLHKSENIKEILEDRSVGQAISSNTEWSPHALNFSGKYEDGTTLSGIDFFYDKSIIIRKLYLPTSTEYFSFSGSYQGEIKIVKNRIIVDNNNIRYSIGFSQDIKKFKKSEKNWVLKLDKNKKKESVIISIAFAERGETEKDLLRKSQKPFFNDDVNEHLKIRESYWDTFLTKVPHPRNFKFSKVDPNGVTPEQLKLAYYKSWVFIAQNVLPADQELFPYPQIATGKASLWDMGEERAPFSAAWESFIGIQLYSYIDPELSWKAFKGLMSLVDEEGMLGGESLPSRKAQTAMILYAQTKDKNSLEEVYPALERYLNWRIKITHWVFNDILPTEETKDANFVFPALVDMEHMRNIALILGKTDNAEEWKQKHKKFSEKALEWFWKTPKSKPVQMYDIETGERKPGNTVWITPAFYVNDLLSGDYKNSMVNRFDENFDSQLGFAGFYLPKYPDISYTVYGLLKHGMKDRALGMIEANLRDIVKANTVFAEQYVAKNFRPDGVRPSLFGASVVIDFVWLLNGYKYDRGHPELVMIPSEYSRGLYNINFAGGIYNLQIEKEQTSNRVFWGLSSKSLDELESESKTVKRLPLNHLN